MTGSRTRAMTLLVVAFVAGAAIGGGTLAMLVRAGKAEWFWRMARPAPGRQGPGRSRPQYGVVLDSTLKLGLDQPTKDTISAIWRRGVARIDSIWGNNHEMWAKVDSVLQPYRAPVEASRTQTRNEIRALLSAPQQVRYDSLVKAADEMRRRRREQGPGSGSGSRGGPGDRGGPGGPGNHGPEGSGQRGGGGFDRGPF